MAPPLWRRHPVLARRAHRDRDGDEATGADGRSFTPQAGTATLGSGDLHPRTHAAAGTLGGKVVVVPAAGPR